MVEFAIPDTVQFDLTVPRKEEPKIIGKLPDYHYSMCFSHAVKAVMAGLKPKCTLNDIGYEYCDFCSAPTYSAHEKGWYDNKPPLDGGLL